MSKFSEQFSEPVAFSDQTWIMNGNYSREDAAEQLEAEIGEKVDPLGLEPDRVRFGFAPDMVEDMAGQLCWYTGAKGKGSMPVWVYG